MSFIQIFLIIIDDTFSIETGLELSGIAGPIYYIWMSGSFSKIIRKMIDNDRLLPFRCLSQFSLVKKKKINRF